MNLDTSDNGLISRFGRLRGSAAAAFRPFRPVWRSGLFDWGRFRPVRSVGERDPGRFRPWRAAGFGRAFWKLLAAETPLTIAAMSGQGAIETAYSGRYLCTPLALRLLYEVVRHLPGGNSSGHFGFRALALPIASNEDSKSTAISMTMPTGAACFNRCFPKPRSTCAPAVSFPMPGVTRLRSATAGK